MVTLLLSPQEILIIEDIEEVGYGELLDVRKPNDLHMGVKIEVTKHEAFQLLFKELRQQEAFDSIIIHGSLPAYAIISGETEGGHLCVKKYKFS